MVSLLIPFLSEKKKFQKGPWYPLLEIRSYRLWHIVHMNTQYENMSDQSSRAMVIFFFFSYQTLRRVIHT
jgi:hypothetical protein